MRHSRTHIIQQLQRQILPLQGFKQPGMATLHMEMPVIESAFPFGCFPRGAVHEFVTLPGKDMAATSGFICSLLGKLICQSGACIWISNEQSVYPMALQLFNIPADRIIFISTDKEKDMLWIMEEALKCDPLAAVVAEIKEISFAVSRRLQLATEKSQVTAFIIRNQLQKLNTIAAVSRWQIEALPSRLDDGMPGVGFPRWNVTLQKVRNGKPGNWQLEWSPQGYRLLEEVIAATPIISLVKTA